MNLYISTKSPTNEYQNSRLDKAITIAAIKLAYERNKGSLPSGPALDVSFFMAGAHEKLTFSGMRMGNYSADQETLYFERTVPDEILHSNKAEEFVKAVLQDVVSNAAEFFNTLKVDFDHGSWARVLQKMG